MADILETLITGLRVADIIDIAVMSYLIYKVFEFIHPTRAWQLVWGLGVLAAAYALSGLFHLYALHWLLSKVLSVGLIALVIVFQPELRRGLEYIGRGSRIGQKKFKVAEDSPAKSAAALAKAIDYFSSISEGALIIVERQTALSDLAETGTIVDAAISEQLIENIFYVGSPLHDGAVIIRGDRVYAAGCVLPLTENKNLSKDLGTRHRAGIGVSEVSDALVFIVSEETGIISLAEDGKIERFLDMKTVEKTLLNYYLTRGKNSIGFFGRKDNGQR